MGNRLRIITQKLVWEGAKYCECLRIPPAKRQKSSFVSASSLRFSGQRATSPHHSNAKEGRNQPATPQTRGEILSSELASRFQNWPKAKYFLLVSKLLNVSLNWTEQSCFWCLRKSWNWKWITPKRKEAQFGYLNIAFGTLAVSFTFVPSLRADWLQKDGKFNLSRS